MVVVLPTPLTPTISTTTGLPLPRMRPPRTPSTFRMRVASARRAAQTASVSRRALFSSPSRSRSRIACVVFTPTSLDTMTSSICSRMVGSISFLPEKIEARRAMKPVRVAARPVRIPAISRLLTRGTETTGSASSASDGTESGDGMTSDEGKSTGAPLGLAMPGTVGSGGAAGRAEAPARAWGAGRPAAGVGAALGLDGAAGFAPSLGGASSDDAGGSAFCFRMTKKPMIASVTTTRTMTRVGSIAW